MHVRKQYFASFAALGVIAAVLSGCSGSSDTTTSGTPGTSQVRTLNALVPQTGTSGQLTVSSGSTSLTGGSALGFGSFSPASGYQSVQSGSFSPTGVFTPTGGGSTTTMALSPATTNLNGGKYTLAATGQIGQAGTLAPSLILVPSYGNNLTITSNEAAVRLVNLSPGTDNYSLYGASSGTPTVLSSQVNNVPYGYTTADNQFVVVPLSSLTGLSIRASSTPTVDMGLSPASNLNTYSFTGGQAYTIFITGQPDNTSQPLTATVVNDSTGA